MSFSNEQKKEIISQNIKSSAHRRSVLNGILFSKGVISDGVVSISIESVDVYNYAKKLIKEFYGKEVQVLEGVSGRRRLFSFSAPAAIKFFDAISRGEEILASDDSAYQYFLKGIVLASARIYDPNINYLIEFASVRPFELMSFLSDNGIVTYLSQRKNETLLYIKQNNMLEEFFALAGMNNMVFALMNAKIKSEISNSTNRITNCEINNINKAVSAAQKQIEAIKVIEQANLFSTLPEELYETASLRMLHQDLSLTQLAQIAVPKISKPGLSHRLNKIVEIAEKIKNKEKL